jgi:hypothetical protein
VNKPTGRCLVEWNFEKERNILQVEDWKNTEKWQAVADSYAAVDKEGDKEGEAGEGEDEEGAKKPDDEESNIKTPIAGVVSVQQKQNGHTADSINQINRLRIIAPDKNRFLVLCPKYNPWSSNSVSNSPGQPFIPECIYLGRDTSFIVHSTEMTLFAVCKSSTSGSSVSVPIFPSAHGYHGSVKKGGFVGDNRYVVQTYSQGKAEVFLLEMFWCDANGGENLSDGSSERTSDNADANTVGGTPSRLVVPVPGVGNNGLAIRVNITMLKPPMPEEGKKGLVKPTSFGVELHQTTNDGLVVLETEHFERPHSLWLLAVEGANGNADSNVDGNANSNADKPAGESNEESGNGEQSGEQDSSSDKGAITTVTPTRNPDAPVRGKWLCLKRQTFRGILEGVKSEGKGSDNGSDNTNNDIIEIPKIAIPTTKYFGFPDPGWAVIPTTVTTTQIEAGNEGNEEPPATEPPITVTTTTHPLASGVFLLIHGGPHGASCPVFTPDVIFYAQILNLAVAIPNYVGSISYGDAYLQGLQGRAGDIDVIHCDRFGGVVWEECYGGKNANDSSIPQTFVSGGSHGGFMTAHLIARSSKNLPSSVAMARAVRRGFPGALAAPGKIVPMGNTLSEVELLIDELEGRPIAHSRVKEPRNLNLKKHHYTFSETAKLK